MTRRRPPLPEERMSGAQRQMTPGTVDGWVRNTALAPGQIGQAGSLAAGGSSSTAATLFARDRFEAAADGAQSVNLTYVPLANSPHVYLNGQHLDEGGSADYTRAGRTVSLLAAAGVLTGDVVDVRYAYYSGAPTAVYSGLGEAIASMAPVAWWRLDEPSGSTFADSSGNGHDLTITGTPAAMAGTSILPTGEGSAATFATGVYASAADAAWNSPTGAYSVLVNVYNVTYDSFQFYLYKAPSSGAAWGAALNGATTFLALDGPDLSFDRGSALTAYSVFCQVAVTFDGTTLRGYVNGVEEGSGTRSAPSDTAGDLTVGLTSGYNNAFKGQDFAFWGRALSASEVAVLAASAGI